MVEIEQSAQTLPPLNVGGQAHRRWRSLQELVVESLVVSLAMVVFDVLAHEETQVPFAVVTGLVANEFPNVKREYLRSLRSLLYAWYRHGEECAPATCRVSPG